MKYLAAAACAMAAWAQTPPSEPAAGSLSGVVKEATTRVPLEGVRVYVAGASTNESPVTTGPQGQFAFEKLEPGRHWVSVYDSRAAASGGAYVLVKPAEHLTGVEIYLAETAGSISGRVFDEDRRPVSGAAVVLLEAVFEFGRTAYRPNLTALADRNGEYLLKPVPSRRDFLILAKKPIKLIDSPDAMPSDPEKRPRVAVPAFYPGAPDIQGAQAVTLGASEDRSGVDIQMTFAPVFCIDGMVRAAGSPAQELTITEQLPLVFGSSFTPMPATLNEGTFRACGFHPGEYKVVAANREVSRSQRWSAFAHVAITDRDAQDVQLVPGSAVTLSGESVLEPAPRGEAADTRIRVALQKFWNGSHADEAESSHGISGGLSFGDRVRVPGSFTLDGIPIDDYTLDLRELPEGCYAKDATFGGVTVLHAPLRLTQAADGRLHIALACDGGSLAARVTDRDGNPVSNVQLYLMPEETGSAAALHDVLRQTDVENGWSGIIKPLAPGKYLALACDLQMDGTAVPFVKLWRMRSKAKEIEVDSGEAAQVTLEIEASGP